MKAALFSANSEGACPHCKGIGLVYTDLAMMAGVATVCEKCEGKRFTPEVLRYKLRGKNISEVLGMSVAEAQEFFPSGPGPRGAGAGSTMWVSAYLSLGQPLTTLSGGERQRLKLAIHMAEKAGTYVLDEPTSGLHLADVDQLLGLLDQLIDAGNTVIVIEHHLAVMAHADWIIDLGPGAGHDGGQVVFTGTPGDLVANSDTLTAQHLREYLRMSLLDGHRSPPGHPAAGADDVHRRRAGGGRHLAGPAAQAVVPQARPLGPRVGVRPMPERWYQAYLAIPEEARPWMRSFTVRRLADGVLTVDFVLHGDNGPASAWAAAAKPGEASAVRTLRRHFVGLGVSKKDIEFAGYWRRTLTQDDAPTPEDLTEAKERIASLTE